MGWQQTNFLLRVKKETTKEQTKSYAKAASRPNDEIKSKSDIELSQLKCTKARFQ